MDRIKRLRWQQRSLPDDIKQNLSQAEVEVRQRAESHAMKQQHRMQGICRHG